MDFQAFLPSYQKPLNIQWVDCVNSWEKIYLTYLKNDFNTESSGVFFWFQKLAAECQSAGHSGVLVPFKCDLSNEEEILSMFAAIKAQHKGVDVCINNAGLAHPESLLSGKTSGWKNMLDVRA